MKVSFAPLTLLSLLSVTTPVAVSSSGDAETQCNGIPPQLDMVNYLGATLDYDVADRICCHNNRYAEARGYLEEPQVALFDRLDPEKETIFYDVVCGLPLFIAPRGRSFEEFKEESIKHGWPSFRPEEMISENVILHDDGRMESVCLTHLGHNLPESGVDRYCIDLVCIAGSPLAVSESNLKQQFPSLMVSTDSDIDDADTEITAATTTTNSNIVTSDTLLEDPSEYVSSAEQNSGKVTDHTMRNVTIAVVVALVVLALGGIAAWTSMSRQNKKNMHKYKDNNANDKENGMEEEKTYGSVSATD